MKQGIIYSFAVIIFQSFITFYVSKYFHGIQGVIVGNILLYIAVALGYFLVAWTNHNRPIQVKKRMFFAIVICIFAVGLMQLRSTMPLLIGYTLLGFGKGIYFCALFLYEFELIPLLDRTKYSAIMRVRISAGEVLIPLILGLLFMVTTQTEYIYLYIFLATLLCFFFTALSIYTLPDLLLKPIKHSDYKGIFHRTSRVSIVYLAAQGALVMIPLIGSLIEIQVLKQEERVGIFQSVTKLCAILVLLIILRFSHIHHPTRYLMILSGLVGLGLLLLPRWSGIVMLIVFVVIKSFLLSLYVTYEKPIGMKVMESMRQENTTILPIIICKEFLQTLVRVGMLVFVYIILSYYEPAQVTMIFTLFVGFCFFLIAGLIFYYLYERAHGYVIVNK